MFDRIATPIIALGLAFLVWLYIRSVNQEVVERNIPVVFRLSPQQRDLYEFDDKLELPVSFTGPPSRIREVQAMVRRGEISLTRTITVPESHLQADRFTYNDTFAENQINVPAGVRVDIPLNRRAFQIVLRRMIKKTLKVRARFTPEDAERVANPVVKPAEVEVRGPQEILAKEEFLPTTLIRLPETVAEKEAVQELAVLLSDRLNEQTIERSPPGVTVTFTLKPAQRIHEVQEVPVHFLTPASFPFTPKFMSDRAGTITLKVRGPAQKPVGIIAFVDLTRKQYEPGLQPDDLVIVYLPPGYELVQKQPRFGPFKLDPIPGTTKPPG